MKQPSIIKFVSFTTACERFGYYTLSFLVILYAKNTFGYSDNTAIALFSMFTALCYFSSPLGGYIADNFLGIRRSILLGLLLEGSGLALLMVTNRIIFTLSLALVALGSGLFKTGPPNILGRSYLEKNPRIESGFTIYYIAANVGTFIAAIGMGIIQQYLGWKIAFVIGSIGLLTGLIYFYLFNATTKDFDSYPSNKKFTLHKSLLLLAGLCLIIPLATYLISNTNIGQLFVFGSSLLVLIYFAYQIGNSPKEEKINILACLAYIFIGMAFFVFYFQIFTSFVLFINRCVNRVVLGWQIPTIVYFSLSSFFVIVIGKILVKLYDSLATKGGDLNITTKFTLGLLITSCGFFAIILGINHVNAQGQLSSWWIVLTYLLVTTGELLVSALGNAIIAKLAPKRLYGVMIGSYYLLAIALASWIAKLLATLSEIPESLHDPWQILQIYRNAFLTIGIIGLVCTTLAWTIGHYLRYKVSALKY